MYFLFVTKTTSIVFVLENLSYNWYIIAYQYSNKNPIRAFYSSKLSTIKSLKSLIVAQTLYLWTGTFRKWSGNFGFLDTLLCNKTTNFLENLAPSKILTNWKCCELFWIGSIERDKTQQNNCSHCRTVIFVFLFFLCNSNN